MKTIRSHENAGYQWSDYRLGAAGHRSNYSKQDRVPFIATVYVNGENR